MWYDLVCVIILGLSMWRGMIKGFVWQLASIAGIILCFIFAETVSLAVAPHIGLDPPLSRWIAILGLYIVGSFVAFAIARTIKGGLEKAKFDDFDRHLGAIFGFVKGAALCLVASFFLFTISERTRETIMHSNAGYASAVLFEQINPVMPEELHALLAPYLQGFDTKSITQHRHDHPVGPDDHLGHHHDDETDHDDPFDMDSPIDLNSPSDNPFDLYPSNPTPATPVSQTSPTIEQMVKEIPGLFSEDLQRAVAETIRNTNPEDRPELLQQLNSGIPGLIRQVAQQWQNGKPENKPELLVTDWRQHRAALLRDIAGVYTEHLEAQNAIMEEVVYSLNGIPDPVTVSVLEDWHADLLKKSADPDPSTDMRTSLDQRVVNQLSQARIALGELPAEVQQRLADLPRR